MGWFGNNNAEEEEEIEEPEEAPDKAICPHCNQEISKVKVVHLGNAKDAVGFFIDMASCSECNKILGVFEY